MLLTCCVREVQDRSLAQTTPLVANPVPPHQVALLKADWPPALLDHPDGAPVLVLSPHDPRDVKHANATLAALGLLSPSRMLSSRHMSGSGVHKRGSLAGGGSGTVGVERSEGAIKHQAQQLQLHPGRGSLKAMLPGTGSAFGSLVTGGVATTGSSSCKELSLSHGLASSAFTAESSGLGSAAPAVPAGARRTLAALRPSSLGVVGHGSSPQVHLFAPLTPTASPGEAPVPSGAAVGAAGVVLESPFTAAGAPAANTPATAGQPGAVGHPSGGSRDTCWVSGSGVAALFPTVLSVGGGSAGGANGAMAVDALVGPGGCSWKELLGAAFPVLPMETPEGRRLAMLLGAGGGGSGGGGGGGGGSRRGMSGRSGSLGGGGGGGGGEGGDEEGEEGQHRAHTGLEEVFGSMTGAGAQLLQGEGWRPGPYAPVSVREPCDDATPVRRAAWLKGLWSCAEQGRLGVPPRPERRCHTRAPCVACREGSRVLPLVTTCFACGCVVVVSQLQCVHLPDGRLAVVAFRGLRVRMGLHTGLDDPESVAFNKVSSAYAYKGERVRGRECLGNEWEGTPWRSWCWAETVLKMACGAGCAA